MHICILSTHIDSLGTGGDITQRTPYISTYAQKSIRDRVTLTFTFLPSHLLKQLLTAISSTTCQTLPTPPPARPPALTRSCLLSATLPPPFCPLFAVPTFALAIIFLRIYQSLWNKRLRGNNFKILSPSPRPYSSHRHTHTLFNCISGIWLLFLSILFGRLKLWLSWSVFFHCVPPDINLLSVVIKHIGFTDNHIHRLSEQPPHSDNPQEMLNALSH